jgi:hypothetical protein
MSPVFYLLTYPVSMFFQLDTAADPPSTEAEVSTDEAKNATIATIATTATTATTVIIATTATTVTTTTSSEDDEGKPFI